MNPAAPVVVTPRGLTTAQAVAKLAEIGPNVLPPPPRPAAWQLVLGQMTHFFALMLWVAGGLAFLARMPQLGVAIFVVVVVNGLFAYAQEHRAERAADRLRDLLPRLVTVERDGRARELAAEQLVPGDLVLLAPGDRVSADLEVVEAAELFVDTSTLTGESVPESCVDGDVLHAGTFIVGGEAAGLVRATGAATRLAGIAALTTAGPRPRTPLAIELDRVVRTVAVVAVAVGTAFLGLALAIGTSLSDGFLFAIGVTVALVPEGLLPTVTLSLAFGAQRMADRHALVRRLEAVETLGSATFICTDKTGTLTRNEMAVVEVWTPSGGAQVAGEGYGPDASIQFDDGARPAVAAFAIAAAHCCSGSVVLDHGHWSARGDPMEAALVALARRVATPDAFDVGPGELRRRFPFDPRRRRMSMLFGNRLIVKGAPDSVLVRCRPSAGATEAVERMTARGLRVLAVAERRGGFELDAGTTADEAESHLDLLGLAGLEDPPRDGMVQAIASCRAAGIRVAMVTGDHPATARAIAVECGLAAPGGMVIEGKDLPDDEQLLGALVDRDGIVLARIAPEDKLRIARALRTRGHVVAMTGDGVNDGPALHEADIGVAMGRSGTDVAREAADLVLLDDDFSTIVAAIGQGRATFANLRRFLTYHLTDNVAELTPFVVWALSGGRFPLALGVLQVLSLDIGTDMLPALALGAEPPEGDVLRHPIVPPPDAQVTGPGHPAAGSHLLDRLVLRRAFGVLGLTEAAMEMGAFVVALLAAGWRPGADFPTGAGLAAASGAAFTAVVIGQFANAFCCRSTTRWPGAVGWTGNRLLLVAVAAEAALLTAFLFAGPVSDLLDQAVPPWSAALVAVAAAPVVLASDALDKALRRRSSRRRTTALPSVS